MTHGGDPAAARAARRLESAAGLDPTVDALRDVVARLVDPRPGLAATLRGRGIGHPLHPLLTDVPIGLWTGAAVLDLVGGEGSHAAADRLLGLGVVTFVPTAVTGWADWSVSDTSVRRVGVVHALANGGAAVLFATSWLLRRADRRAAGVVVSMTATAIVAAAGYLGGHMAYRLGAPTGGPEGSGRRPVRAGEAGASGVARWLP